MSVFPLMNWTVDVQDPWRDEGGRWGSKALDEETFHRYIETIENSAQILREHGVPTLRMTIGDNSQLYPATQEWSHSGDAPIRDKMQRSELKLSCTRARTDEDVFTKRFSNAFTDIEDVRANSKLAKYLVSQRPDNILQNGSIANATFGEVKLKDRLQELGVKSVTIMGGQAGFCVAQNALAAVMHGYDCTVITDRITGWRDNSYEKAVWYPDNPQYHVDEIKSALAEIVKANDPEKYGYKASDQAAIVAAVAKIKYSTFDDYIASLQPGLPPDQKAQPPKCKP